MAYNRGRALLVVASVLAIIGAVIPLWAAIDTIQTVTGINAGLAFFGASVDPYTLALDAMIMQLPVAFALLAFSFLCAAGHLVLNVAK